MRTLTIDCKGCAVRGAACDDCVVQVLLGPPAPASLTADEQAAVAVLAGRGLVPPLRLVPQPAWDLEAEPLCANA